MILFLISFLMVFISSYLIASIFEVKKFKTGLIYLYLIMFAQVVLSLEFLSLFKAISEVGILALNIIMLTGAVFFWQKKGKPLYKPQIKQYFTKIFNAVKRDKILGVMAIGFLFFITVTIFLCILVPVKEYDSLSYHFNRAIVWALQGSLMHFDIADDRNINMAINSEIMYTWFLTFVHKNMLIRFFTFIDYLFAITALSAFLEINKFSIRKRLWTIFLFTSLAGITIGASGVETNIMIGALALAGVFLFQLGTTKSLISPLYFSALALALGIGAKSSILFMLPAVALILLYFLLKYQKKNFLRYVLIFTGFSALNFALFASYNYVLNFIEFGNVMGSAATVFHHKMIGGIKGYISGLIRHLVLLIDFSGFTYALALEKYVFALQNKLLTFLQIPLDLNVITDNDKQLNIALNDSVAGGGVIGILILLPCILISLVKPLFSPKSYRNNLFALLAISLFISIAVMSASIGFMKYSSRFELSFLILCAPVLAISYIKSNKNIFKYLILFYVMSYFTVISTHILARNAVILVNKLMTGASISDLRDRSLCSTNFALSGTDEFCALRSELYKLPKSSKIGIFPSHIDNLAIIKLMDFEGYKTDLLLIENAYSYNLANYDYLVFTKDNPISSFSKNPYELLKNYYVKDNTINFVDKNKPECVITERKVKNILITPENQHTKTPVMTICSIPYKLLEDKGFYQIGQIIYSSGEDVMRIFKR